MPDPINAAPVDISPVKPGIKTSEFWLTGGTVASILYALPIPPTWKAVGASVLTAVYTISRIFAKW